jgi:iron complex outermembrane recepter protein
MKFLNPAFIFIASIISFQAFAQTGSIHGTVKTPDGQPAPNASVVLKSTTLGANTDTNGQYEIKNVQLGSYTLETSLVGYNVTSTKVDVSAGQSTQADIQLEPSITELQSVEIIGRRESSYKSDYSFSATKTQTAIIDIPQTVSTVTKELIQDQQSYRLKDVVKIIAGTNQFSVYDDIVIRGFRNSSSNGRLLNGLRTYNNFWQSPLLVNIERIEVIKGPASAMFSNTNPGGTVNMVTKKPLDEQRIGLNFTTGSWNTYRATADFTGPMTSDKKVLYRVNLGYENAESFRDYTPSKTFVVAPSVSFIPNDNTRLNIDMVYTQNNGVLDRGRPVRSGELDIFATPINLTLTQPGDYLNFNDLSLSVSLNQKITDNISFNTSYMKFQHDQLLNEHRIQRYINPDSIELIFIDRIVKTYFDNVTNYFIGKFNTGNINHQVLVGYDYIYNEYEFIEQNAVGAAAGLENFSLRNPKNYKRPISTYQLKPSSSNALNYYSTHGIYIQEQMTVGKFQALLGLRQEYYIVPEDDSAIKRYGKEDKQSTLLPRLGLVYSLQDNINVYATYAQGYEPQGAASNINPNAGGPFNPLTGNLYEAGAKGEFFSRRLFAGLSIYQIEQNNILVNANNPANPDQLSQRGQERARGVEIETSGQIFPNLSVSLTYAYNKAEITESNDETLVGLVKENAPLHNSGSWIKYSIEKGKLNGIGFALGHSHNTERRTFSKYPNSQDYLMLPSYVVFNGAIFYSFDKFRLSLNVNNLTNKEWFAGGYNFERSFPGAPRNYLLSFGYSF